ncbi:hypothetical protein K439DRAFT_502043 [Ramaria rubella]|nr:hypothetical protein K439DRAFT_502043 [Ramaria rubella]
MLHFTFHNSATAHYRYIQTPFKDAQRCQLNSYFSSAKGSIFCCYREPFLCLSQVASLIFVFALFVRTIGFLSRSRITNVKVWCCTLKTADPLLQHCIHQVDCPE